MSDSEMTWWAISILVLSLVIIIVQAIYDHVRQNRYDKQCRDRSSKPIDLSGLPKKNEG